MILSCNLCKKKFVVPDQAITAAGRMVQCGSCGNKWKQYPVKKEVNEITPIKKIDNKKISKKTKIKKKTIKKTREIDLYSPEYLAKKHGIILNSTNTDSKSTSYEKVSFGFYNLLIVFVVVIISLSKGLHFFQDFIVLNLPFTEFYLDYFFESIKNLFEILKNLIYDY
tara:strand:+ start:88 stop:591 length:504 start_codon:yes stop_codon:yes gene_type:complete